MAQITTTNQMVREFERVLGKPELIPMDRAVLEHLVEVDGSAPTHAIPAKLFRGEIPAGHPDMVALGLIEHRGELVVITDAGRAALA